MAFCFKCGGRLTAEDAFCPGCGTPVDEKAAAQAANEPVPAPAPPTPPPVMLQPVYMYPAPQPVYAPPPPSTPKSKKQPKLLYPQGSKIPMVAGIIMAVAVVFSVVININNGAGVGVGGAMVAGISGILFVVLAFTAGKKRPALFIVPFIVRMGMMAFIPWIFLSAYSYFPRIYLLILEAISIIVYCLCLPGVIKSHTLRIVLTSVIFAAMLFLPCISRLRYGAFDSEYYSLYGTTYGKELAKSFSPELLTFLAYILVVAGLKNAPKAEEKV